MNPKYGCFGIVIHRLTPESPPPMNDANSENGQRQPRLLVSRCALKTKISIRSARARLFKASHSIFQLFLTDEEQFANLQLWKNLLLRTCRDKLWEGEMQGKRVQVWGCGTALASNG
jgi:hypothetical protein